MKNAFAIGAVLAAVGMLAAAICSFAIDGCQSTIATVSSGNVPMKCHWAFLAAGTESIAGLIVALVGLKAKSKEARRIAGVATLVMAVLVLLNLWLVIDVCASGMQCHSTRTMVTICQVISVVGAVLMLAKADPSAASKPKARL